MAPAQHVPLGIVMVCVMALLFAATDTIVRHLGQAVPLLWLLWARYAVQVLLMGAWLLWDQGLAGFRVQRPGFQLLRGGLMLGVTTLSFMGLQRMPVAEFTALAMLTPVLVTLLGWAVLGEAMSPLRWALVLAGFVGMLVIVRPGSGLFGWLALFPLGMAAVFAAFQLLTRRLASQDKPALTHCCTGVVGVLAMSVLMLLFPVQDAPALASFGLGAWLQVLAIGLLASTGHLLLTLALGLAPMSVLMPFSYLQIVGAGLFGGWVFGHVPDGPALAGMAVITVAGALSAWLNVRPAGR